MQVPVKLNVSYAEKDAVKSMGAWWDAKRKHWYISDWQSKKDFAKWLPEYDEIENLAENKAIDYLDSVQRCPLIDSNIFGQCFDVSNFKTDYWNFAHA